MNLSDTSSSVGECSQHHKSPSLKLRKEPQTKRRSVGREGHETEEKKERKTRSPRTTRGRSTERGGPGPTRQIDINIYLYTGAATGKPGSSTEHVWP